MEVDLDRYGIPNENRIPLLEESDLRMQDTGECRLHLPSETELEGRLDQDDDIIERYRKADKEGPISLIEYERYLQYAQESSCHKEFLLRIELDEDLPYRHDREERWLRTECGMRLNPIVAFYLHGLQVFYKRQIEGRYPLNEENLLSNM